uniref:Low-density lipoprotein receptor domain class A n=1 Tax=Caenorhabditis tropicalis TaxID=1561998 RepID=A0A1I7UD36_9PELO
MSTPSETFESDSNTPEHAPRICLPGQFQCHDNRKCLPPGGLCDEVADCADSSDELYCPHQTKTAKGDFVLNSPPRKERSVDDNRFDNFI